MKLLPEKMQQKGATLGQVLAWDGSKWAPATPTNNSIESALYYPTADTSITGSALSNPAKNIAFGASWMNTIGASLSSGNIVLPKGKKYLLLAATFWEGNANQLIFAFWDVTDAALINGMQGWSIAVSTAWGWPSSNWPIMGYLDLSAAGADHTVSLRCIWKEAADAANVVGTTSSKKTGMLILRVG